MNGSNYMSDPKRVEETVKKLFGMSVGEFRRYQSNERPVIDYIIEDIEETFSLDRGTTEKMEFADLLCIVKQSEDYLCAFYDEDSRHQMGLVTLNVLREFMLQNKENCVTFKMFLGIPLRAFYEYLESIACDGRMMTEWKRVSNRICGLYGKESVGKMVGDIGNWTMEEIFHMCGRRMRSYWIPIRDIEEYQKEIIAAHKIAEFILAHSFEMAIPERFRIGDVLSKYQENKR